MGQQSARFLTGLQEAQWKAHGKDSTSVARREKETMVSLVVLDATTHVNQGLGKRVDRRKASG